MPPLSDEGSGCATDPSPSSGSPVGGKGREKPPKGKINQDSSLPMLPEPKGEDAAEANQPQIVLPPTTPATKAIHQNNNVPETMPGQADMFGGVASQRGGRTYTM